jgi:hypothetical protein
MPCNPVFVRREETQPLKPLYSAACGREGMTIIKGKDVKRDGLYSGYLYVYIVV